MDKDFEYYDSLPEPDYSVKHRRKMNRFFREQIGSMKIPHPEVDNCYEQIRSKIILKFNKKGRS